MDGKKGISILSIDEQIASIERQLEADPDDDDEEESIDEEIQDNFVDENGAVIMLSDSLRSKCKQL